MNEPRNNMKSRWSIKYKRSINCSNPKGFSQKNYCKRQKRGGKYKTFKEWLNENEEIKTPDGHTLTPEELEDYEHEKSPMYKALFLKDIDAKRKVVKTPKVIDDKEKPEEKQTRTQPDSTSDHDIDDKELSNRNYCFIIVNVIRHFQDSNYTENYELESLIRSTIEWESSRDDSFSKFHENKKILDILEKSKDPKSAISQIVPILEKLGIKISEKAGSKSKFNPDIHRRSLISSKIGEDVILLSDLITFGGEVLFEAEAIPINDYTLKNYKYIIENPLENLRPTVLSVYKLPYQNFKIKGLRGA